MGPALSYKKLSKNLIKSVLDLALLSTPIPKGTKPMAFGTTKKLLIELETVNIKIPNELLLYSLLGKLAGDSKLHQLVPSLTLNKELIERPNLILNFLQDYIYLTKSKDPNCTNFPSALVSTTNESFKIIHYFTNGKHNPKSTTNKKEECWEENQQLRPNWKDNKKNKFQSKAYLSTANTLITSLSNT
ncbi:hypothetical protein O181_026925 [Austropuccinia psidii MF-1]|uniref:Uncharacterized protein n=1 Tax=Austropuccinia psidii MF-1 TaxID=1389203 RepID=A0A9Q3H2N8_9BASI|nr:hypothetical protein [Austropuccinia psidii MF-1]